MYHPETPNWPWCWQGFQTQQNLQCSASFRKECSQRSTKDEMPALQILTDLESPCSNKQEDAVEAI